MGESQAGFNVGQRTQVALLIKDAAKPETFEWRKTMANEVRFSVMSPEAGVQKSEGAFPPDMGGPAPSSLTMAKRLDTLENKTVYLVDIGFGGGYNFMLQLQKWFTKNMPSVTTIVKRKPGFVFADDNNNLWEEVKEKGHAVVLGVAG
jgi:hypothetical protein